MHHIYETKAIVLAAYPSREADRRLFLYAREFGAIYAAAHGVRELKSKLRYSLQPFSYSVVSLVHGRTGWKITNARLEQSFSVGTCAERSRLVVIARLHSLLRRMVPAEERNAPLFDALVEGFSFLATLPESSLADIELLLVLCVLHHLGYIGKSGTFSAILAGGFWNLEAVAEASRARSTLVRSINESLKASHL